LNYITYTASNFLAQDPSTAAVHSRPAHHTGGAHPAGGAPQPRAHTGGPLRGRRAGAPPAGLHSVARRPAGALRGGPLPEGRRTGAHLAGLHKEARRHGGAPGAAPQGGAETGEPRPRIPLWSSTTDAQQKTGINIFSPSPLIRRIYGSGLKGNSDQQ
jgi:hypothetical protein